MVITALRGHFTGTDNVHVYFRENKFSYVLKSKFLIRCNGKAFFAYIAGEYGDGMVGICTQTGLMKLWSSAKVEAWVFNEKGTNTIPILLPYEEL